MIDDLDTAVVIAVGGNLPGDSPSVQDGLARAVAQLGQAGFDIVAQSRWWRSRAWPDPADPPFLNGVVVVRTGLDPSEAMTVLQRLEAAAGRRPSARNAPRPLDLDLIAHGRTVAAGELVLPHPRAHERLFVMGPLAEIAPAWRHPTLDRTAADLAREAGVGRDARPVAD